MKENIGWKELNGIPRGDDKYIREYNRNINAIPAGWQ